MGSIERLLDAFATSISKSGLGPHILGSDWLRGSRFLDAFDPVMSRAFRSLGFAVRKERPNPFVLTWRREHPGQRIAQQRTDYLLARGRKVAAIAELESLDRAQVYTFKCQFDEDCGKRDYYWATVDHLVRHPDDGPLEFFLFFLTLPDFPVAPYTVWDASDEYYGVTKADREEIFRSPYGFYDHRIKTILREMLLNRDAEAKDWNWLVDGRPLGDFQHVCELVLITLTGSELVLARGRDLLDPAREIRHPAAWAVARR
jgi:hypothetical protein